MQIDELQLFFFFFPKFNLFQKWISSVLEQNSSSSVLGVQSSLGNKRKWVSLPLEEVSREDGAKTPGGGPTRTDTEPNSDSSDPTSPNHTLHNNRAHDSNRSKWPADHCFLSPPSVSCFLLAGLLFALRYHFMFAHHFPTLPSVFVMSASFFYFFFLFFLHTNTRHNESMNESTN